jgi:hypothetical protein
MLRELFLLRRQKRETTGTEVDSVLISAFVSDEEAA